MSHFPFQAPFHSLSASALHCLSKSKAVTPATGAAPLQSHQATNRDQSRSFDSTDAENDSDDRCSSPDSVNLSPPTSVPAAAKSSFGPRTASGVFGPGVSKKRPCPSKLTAMDESVERARDLADKLHHSHRRGFVCPRCDAQTKLRKLKRKRVKMGPSNLDLLAYSICKAEAAARKQTKLETSVEVAAVCIQHKGDELSSIRSCQPRAAVY